MVAIGSGGAYATAAARALLQHTELSSSDIVKAAMDITAELCIYTNDKILIEVTKQSDESETNN